MDVLTASLEDPATAMVTDEFKYRQIIICKDPLRVKRSLILESDVVIQKKARRTKSGLIFAKHYAIKDRFGISGRLLTSEELSDIVRNAAQVLHGPMV